jgi:hypothetical protein
LQHPRFAACGIGSVALARRRWFTGRLARGHNESAYPLYSQHLSTLRRCAIIAFSKLVCLQYLAGGHLGCYHTCRASDDCRGALCLEARGRHGS